MRIPSSSVQPAPWSFDDAPLSDVRAPLLTGACYVGLVLLLEYVIRVRRGGVGIDTKRAQFCHNMVLCAASLVMVVGTSSQLIARVRAEGGRFLFCEDPSTRPTGELFRWSYIYYLSKYYELLDTVLQLLKGRPPPHFFLHVYHHACVLLMAWAWLRYAMTLQFIGLLFNTAVHVIMYYYYARRVAGLPVTWKRHVTKLQLVQFGTSFACGLVTLRLLLGGASCAGTWPLLGNSIFNLTLMLQFVGVLGRGKGGEGKGGEGGKGGESNGGESNGYHNGGAETNGHGLTANGKNGHLKWA